MQCFFVGVQWKLGPGDQVLVSRVELLLALSWRLISQLLLREDFDLLSVAWLVLRGALLIVKLLRLINRLIHHGGLLDKDMIGFLI